MDIYLKNGKEKDTFHFPVNPLNGITVNRSKRFETAEIIGIGEIDFSDGSKKIKELSFDTLLPKEYDSFCRYLDIPDPIQTINKLEKWMEQEEPLRLIITNFDFNGLVIISNIKEDERAGEVGDKYINISFRAKRELKIEALPTTKTKTNVATNTKVSTQPKLKNNRTSSNSKPKTYTVKNGDSLWKIAKKFYGSGSKWKTIYNKNKKVIGKNPNIIKPGQKLVIP